MRLIRPWMILLVLGTPVWAAEVETREDAIEAYFAQAEGKELPWAVNGGIGLTFKDGNTDILTFAARLSAEKNWERDLLRFTLQSIYSRDSGIETASEHILVQRWERYFGEKHRFWQQLWLETDSQESLSLRLVLTAGYGYRFVKTENFVLWGEIGGGYQGERFYGGRENNEGIAQINIEWTWQVTKQLLYEQVIQFWPSLSEGGEFKFIFDAKLTLPVSERWSFSLIVQDKYDSQPVDGNEKNDLTVIFTLNFDFTKKEKKE
ncbi:MAG: DUF481 domain-containing protein [Planctomycetota bacterium]